MRSRLSVMPFVVLALLSGVAVLPASAETSDPSAGQLAAALASGSNVITGAEYIEGPPSGEAVLVGTEAIAGFPREGGSFALLSTGAAGNAYLPNDDGNRTSDYGTISTRSSVVHDVTVLKVDLTVPAAANCLLGVDFRFLSEEAGVRRQQLQRCLPRGGRRINLDGDRKRNQLSSQFRLRSAG